ncbi:MAG: BON domain-containing protein, partial [Phycisphaerales bacterium]|nr:BON domain-containing protein [Hyphomonadaceae bacterium]
MIEYPDTESDPRPPIAFWSAIGCAVVAMLLGIVAPHGGSAWRMPQILEQRVAGALISSGYPGLDMEMDGQRAVLRGFVEHEDDIEGARRAALTAAGAGGAWAGGVTDVDVSGVSVGAFDRPYVWSVRRDGARVVLSGAVPSENVRADLLGVARAVFANADPVDEMRIAGGAPSPAFGQVARDAVRALA